MVLVLLLAVVIAILLVFGFIGLCVGLVLMFGFGYHKRHKWYTKFFILLLYILGGIVGGFIVIGIANTIEK
jgi:hypothetical protein